MATAVSYPQDARSQETYRKVIALYNEAKSGSHPRFNFKLANGAGLSESANANAATITPFQNGTSTLHAPLTANNGTPAAFQFPPGLNNIASSSSPAQVAPQLQHQPPKSAVGPTPQFNPILLQKSDVLNKAELKLKEQRLHQANQEKLQADRLQELKNSRQRIEKLLHQELQNKEKDREDTNQHIIADALTKAQAKVPAVSGIKSPTPVPVVDAASSESFDENSYYSSKANTWSTERSDPYPDPNDPDPDAMEMSDADDDLYEEYEPPAQIAIDPQQAIGGAEQQRQVITIPGLGDDTEHDDLEEHWEPEWDEDEEEDDYEPPAPQAFRESVHASQRSQPLAYSNQHLAASEIRPQGRQPQHSRNDSGNRIHSPISVAVNHIPTPVAPQPSRISPMVNTLRDESSSVQYGQAAAQAGGYNGNGRMTGNDSRRPSPNGAKGKGKAPRRANAYATGSAKRKRAASPDARAKPKKKQRQPQQPIQFQPQPQSMPQPLMSPEPYIKPEPVSPTGFGRADHAPSRRTSYREAPITLDASPRIARPRSAYYEYDQSPRGYRSADDLDRVAMPPPAVLRRAERERDNHDLRRVASLQHARRPMSPGYAPHAEPAYEVTERPYAREPAYREPSVRPDGVRYMRAPRSPSPPRVADPYARARSPALMPPPPARQVIVDEFGTRYYAEPAPIYASPRRAEIDPRYERASTRAPIRVADPYEEDPFRGMPPPPRARAYSRVPDAEIVDHRAHERAFSVRPQAIPIPVDVDRRERAYSVRPQAVPAARSMRGQDYDDDVFARPPPPRFDDAPREYVPRAYSVHPEAPRVPEYTVRPGSVHPEAYARRAMPPPPPARGEPIVLDAEGYGGRYAPPVPRYADEVEPAEEAQYGDGRRVVSNRY
ncbi:hypothetical protein EG328_007157 [Venturia inaequalis]|uniref:Uncharacterized protein n=1 Tax=Venturia inaequalis TaxID=5025 RepID=A0A8H3UGF5_VENIN|nr:hypothetical protein EG328_007157 [Venturia inaequalis]